MSVVVAIESDDGVIVGCDSFFGTDDVADAIDREKWFRVGDALVAWTGGAKVPHLAEHARWRPKRREGETDHSFVRRLAERLRALHVKHRSPVRENQYLLVYEGKVWEAADNGSVSHSAHGYAAIGAGEDFALGSLASTDGDPELRVQWALAAAERHSPKVNGPFRILECRYGYSGPPALSVVRDPHP